MARISVSFLRDPIEKILSTMVLSKKGLQNRSPEKLAADKDSRPLYLSHLAYVMLYMIGEKESVGPSGAIEVLTRQYAKEHLTEKERQRAETIANAMTEHRQQLIDALIQEQETQHA